MKKGTRYKLHYWSEFNQVWMWNGEGVKNWREQGFQVKLLILANPIPPTKK